MTEVQIALWQSRLRDYLRNVCTTNENKRRIQNQKFFIEILEALRVANEPDRLRVATVIAVCLLGDPRDGQSSRPTLPMVEDLALVMCVSLPDDSHAWKRANEFVVACRLSWNCDGHARTFVPTAFWIDRAKETIKEVIQGYIDESHNWLAEGGMVLGLRKWLREKDRTASDWAQVIADRFLRAGRPCECWRSSEGACENIDPKDLNGNAKLAHTNCTNSHGLPEWQPSAFLIDLREKFRNALSKLENGILAVGEEIAELRVELTPPKLQKYEHELKDKKYAKGFSIEECNQVVLLYKQTLQQKIAACKEQSKKFKAERKALIEKFSPDKFGMELKKQTETLAKKLTTEDPSTLNRYTLWRFIERAVKGCVGGRFEAGKFPIGMLYYEHYKANGMINVKLARWVCKGCGRLKGSRCPRSEYKQYHLDACEFSDEPATTRCQLLKEWLICPGFGYFYSTLAEGEPPFQFWQCLSHLCTVGCKDGNFYKVAVGEKRVCPLCKIPHSEGTGRQRPHKAWLYKPGLPAIEEPEVLHEDGHLLEAYPDAPEKPESDQEKVLRVMFYQILKDCLKGWRSEYCEVFSLADPRSISEQQILERFSKHSDFPDDVRNLRDPRIRLFDQKVSAIQKKAREELTKWVSNSSDDSRFLEQELKPLLSRWAKEEMLNNPFLNRRS